MSNVQDTQPDPAPPAPAALLEPRRRRAGRRSIAVLVVLGLAGVAGGGAGLYLELTRAATRPEVAAAVHAEVASRWRRLPSGKVFPATVSYLTSAGMRTQAHRVGIARAATCAAALDPVAARAFGPKGCSVVLRATYVDSSGTVATTVGIAVMPSNSAAVTSVTGFGRKSMRAGVRAVAFPGTLARLFRNTQRVWFSATPGGPYVFFSTAGYTSGLYSHRAVPQSAFSDLGDGFSAQESAVLTSAAKPCQREDIRC